MRTSLTLTVGQENSLRSDSVYRAYRNVCDKRQFFERNIGGLFRYVYYCLSQPDRHISTGRKLGKIGKWCTFGLPATAAHSIYFSAEFISYWLLHLSAFCFKLSIEFSLTVFTEFNNKISENLNI